MFLQLGPAINETYTQPFECDSESALCCIAATAMQLSIKTHRSRRHLLAQAAAATHALATALLAVVITRTISSVAREVLAHKWQVLCKAAVRLQASRQTLTGSQHQLENRLQSNVFTPAGVVWVLLQDAGRFAFLRHAHLTTSVTCHMTTRAAKH